MILFVSIIVGVIILDLLTKWLSVGAFIEIIPNVLEIRYSENTGVAWSIGADNPDIFRWLISAFGIIVAAGCVIFFIFYKNKTKVLTVGMSLFAAGTIGNIADRLLFGYVRDFIYIKLIDFPIFNAADMAICFGVVLIMWYILFQNKRSANGLG
jgi:signal peptidase II